MLAAAMLVGQTACARVNKDSYNKDNMENTEKILFINGSPNKDGHTAGLAKALLEGKAYDTLSLTDYRINFYGQALEGDQFDEVLRRMRQYDVIVMGSPVYWHTICASVRALMERFYGTVEEGSFRGKQFFFLYQGAAPTQKMLDDGEYSMKRFAEMYGFTYEGMANTKSEARSLRAKVGK